MRLQHIIYNDPTYAPKIHDSLRVDEAFIHHLESSNDWTAMILAWSLLEACISEAISIQLTADSILPLIQKLPLNGRAGKVEMAYALGLLSREEKKFVANFSVLRNKLAHGTSLFGFKFSEYYNDFDAQIEAEKSLIFSEVTEPESKRILTFRSDPRLLVISNAIFVCLNAIGTAGYDESDRYHD